MCGIFGAYLPRPLRPDDASRFRALRDSLAHRGPDGAGEWRDDAQGLYLGHRRLSIIDLSNAGAQPMSRGRLVLVYNGEIYNYRELHDELAAAGHRFRGTSDTEVLLAAWEQWGQGALDRVDGMFAFVLWDGERLHLATDPFGEKPLYLASTRSGVWFSSEAGPLINGLDLAFEPTREECESFLALGFMPLPATGYRGLEQLPPATYIQVSSDGVRLRRRYWSPPSAQAARGRVSPLGETDLDLIHGSLVESLRRRLRADVPVGLFLSAGVDSALLAALASKDGGKDLTALTVSFPDGADEAGAARAIASHLGLPHDVVDGGQSEDWTDTPDRLIDLYGGANDNLTALPIEQMSRLARMKMKVALAGVGGDELFYGYNRHRFLWDHRAAYRLPAAPFRLLDGVLRNAPFGTRIGTAARILSGTRAFRFLTAKNGGNGEVISRLAAAIDRLDASFPRDGRDLVFQARDFDLRESLPGSYIAATDRGSMRAGLEVRTPFLSRRLVECLAQFDQRALLAFGQKSVLRRLLARYLPRTLTDRPKQGFVFPARRFLAARSDMPLEVSCIDGHTVSSIWRRRDLPECRGLAVRLSILNALEAGGGSDRGRKR